MIDNRSETIDLQRIWENLLRNHAMDQENAIPAVVLSYDRAKNLVTCRPAINRVDVGGEPTERAEVVVPCFNPYGNGLGINFPLQPGDTGWIVAADRDSTNFKNTRAVASPNTDLLHRYAFGVFMPDRIHGFNIKPEDAKALVIESLSGDTRISILETENGASRVKITRKTASVEVNGFDLILKTPTSEITVADDGTVNIKATQTTIDGTCAVTTGASGVITMASVATVANGIVTAIY